MIKEIEQGQEQLIALSNKAVNLNNIDNFETDAQDIAKQVFAGGDWPDDLQPWPMMCIRYSDILRAHGRLVGALKQGVRGYFLLARRTGDTWIQHLFGFIQMLSNILAPSEKEVPFGKQGFPTEAQLWDMLYGYLHELALGAMKMFGAGAGYSRAIQAWYSEYMEF